MWLVRGWVNEGVFEKFRLINFLGLVAMFGFRGENRVNLR